MRLLWTKSKLPFGPIICWGLDEPVSHFAIEFFDNMVLQSNFFGVHILHKKDFDHYSDIKFHKPIEMDLHSESVLLCLILQNYYGKAYDWRWFFSMCVNAFKTKILRVKHNDDILWRSRDRFLCTEIVTFLEPVIGQVDVGNGSPFQLALRLGAAKLNQKEI